MYQILISLEAQFNRCLDQHYGIVLGPAEDFIIVKKFGDSPQHPGMVNYRLFCKAVNVGELNICDGFFIEQF